MILPTKHISADYSLVGVGALLLRHLKRPQTVTLLWSTVCEEPTVSNFDRFILTLDFLYTIGAIELEDNLLRRAKR
jgi:hypothetical protein